MSSKALSRVVAVVLCTQWLSLSAFASDAPDPLDIRVLLSQSAVRPGDRFQIAVEIIHTRASFILITDTP